MNYNLLLVGRFIFGIGCENQIYTIMVVEWFYHFELSLGLGLSEVLPLCASFAAGLIIPRVYIKGEDAEQCFTWSFGVGFLLCLWSYLCMIALQIMDYIVYHRDQKLLASFKVSKGMKDDPRIEKKKAQCFSLSDFRKFPTDYWLVCLSIMFSAQATTNSL